jgi:tetratricopeptide (TPR) repeat protein/type II secretory pathway component PulJ
MDVVQSVFQLALHVRERLQHVAAFKNRAQILAEKVKDVEDALEIMPDDAKRSRVFNRFREALNRCLGLVAELSEASKFRRFFYATDFNERFDSLEKELDRFVSRGALFIGVYNARAFAALAARLETHCDKRDTRRIVSRGKLHESAQAELKDLMAAREMLASHQLPDTDKVAAELQRVDTLLRQRTARAAELSPPEDSCAASASEFAFASPAAAMAASKREKWHLDPSQLGISAHLIYEDMAAEVFEGMYGRERVAIRRLRRRLSSEEEFELFNCKTRALWELVNPRLARVLGCCIKDNWSCIVSELGDCTLHDCLHPPQHSQQWRPLSPTDRLRLAEDVASGLRCAHDEGLVHGNLTARSVHVYRDPSDGVLRAKLAGLGTPLADVAPNVHYAAPETLQQPPLFSFASDVYSLGSLIFEICTGKQPFGSVSEEILRGAKLAHRAKPLLSEIKEHWGFDMAEAARQVAQLIDDCMAANPSHRPSTEKAHRELARTFEKCVQPVQPRHARLYSEFHVFVQPDAIPNVYGRAHVMVHSPSDPRFLLRQTPPPPSPPERPSSAADLEPAPTAGRASVHAYTLPHSRASAPPLPSAPAAASVWAPPSGLDLGGEQFPPHREAVSVDSSRMRGVFLPVFQPQPSAPPLDDTVRDGSPDAECKYDSPRSANDLLKRSRELLLEGRPDEALVEAKRALRCAPNSAEAYAALAEAEAALLRYGDALSDAERALQLDSSCVPALYVCSEVHLASGAFVEALDCARRALDYKPKNTHLLLLCMARAHAELHNFEMSVAEATSALGDHKHRAFALTTRASALLSLNRVADARRDVAEALRLEPANVEALRLQKEVEKRTAPR